MDYDAFNKFCSSLKATTYVVQWGDSHVWKVADFFFMQDQPGCRAAPYMASRGMKWIQVYDCHELSEAEVKSCIKESYRLVSLGLTRKKQKELGLF